ncbi:Arc family DNA-binding protein [Candidatus Sumerlaeota bacterium]|nr:Arc family DNA-binding protein [Candidatus Sumerlaeota bacterium]
MIALTIKNVPDGLYKSLKESAKADHRSINREVIARLEQVLSAKRIDPETLVARIKTLNQQVRGPRLTDRVLRQAKEKGRQ